ncbi:unnamed protein product [Larinioides sclopetarius]|uniref:BTB domain-containing protein n=1 Tax=Larinioides sclopetarius TaxID=280406 RepID=A0AAV2ACP3_9ARAC
MIHPGFCLAWFWHPFDPLSGVDDFLNLQRNSHDAGPESVLLKIKITVMKVDGSILSSEDCENTFRKGDERRFMYLLTDIRFRERKNTDYLHGDTLGVRCRMWLSGESVQMVRQCTARTRIRIVKISFLHRVENFSALKLGEKRILQIPSPLETGCAFTSILSLSSAQRGRKVVQIRISRLPGYKALKRKLSVINVSGNITKCYEYDYGLHVQPGCYYLTRQFILDKRKEYLPNDELSLLCEFTFNTGVDHVKMEEILQDIPVAVFEQKYIIPNSNNDEKAAEDKLSSLLSALKDIKLNHSDQRLTNVNLKDNTLSTNSNAVSTNIFGIHNQVLRNDPHKNKYNAAEKLSMGPSALDDFKALYNDQLLTDLVLKTATKSFSAHKNVLCARSSVFRAMLTNDMKEKNTHCIKVEDLENETVQRLLLFLYSDSLEELQWESAIQLYYAADKYAIERLKVFCSFYLVNNVSTSTASEFLLLSDTHSDTNLKKFVEHFILEHEDEVFCSVEWEKLNGTNPHLVFKTMQLKYKRDKGTHIRKQKTQKNSNNIIYNSAKELSKCPSALDDFNVLCKDQLLTDVVLKTATKSFRAHRNVLCARSSVFKAMLINDMKEKNTDSIKVEDLEDDTVQRLLLFLYSDNLEELQWESAVQLYNAANNYAIERLKVLCSSFLVDNLSSSMASELLLLADTHNDTDLKRIVEDFILEHDEEVFCSDEWENLSQRNPHLFMKTMQLKYKRRKEGKEA